jgi:hypothetical protein
MLGHRVQLPGLYGLNFARKKSDIDLSTARSEGLLVVMIRALEKQIDEITHHTDNEKHNDESQLTGPAANQ